MSKKIRKSPIVQIFDPVSYHTVGIVEAKKEDRPLTIGTALEEAGGPLTSYVTRKYREEGEKAEKEEAALNASLKASLASITSQSDVDTAAVEAARLEEEKMKKRKGYKSTILTSAQGITQPAPTYRTTLG